MREDPNIYYWDGYFCDLAEPCDTFEDCPELDPLIISAQAALLEDPCPAPCVCPEGLPETLNVHLPAGTKAAGILGPYAWDAQDVTVAENAPCDYSEEAPSAFNLTDNGTPVTGGVNLILDTTNAPGGPCKWVCRSVLWPRLTDGNVGEDHG